MLYNCPVILFMFDITNEESYIRIKKIIKYISLIDKEDMTLADFEEVLNRVETKAE